MKRRSKPSVFRDWYRQPYNDLTRVKLYNSTKDSLELVQRLRLTKKLPIHNGCVNSLCWNETGEYLLSGSDDQHLVVTHAYNYKVLSDYKTSHRANIFSAKFLPACGDVSIISCSGDGIILYTDLLRKEDTHFNQFNCHSGTTYEVITVPNDPNSFLSCGEDGTVRWFDLRIKTKCTKPHCKEDIMITCPRAVTALSISPVVPYHLAIGCSDSTVRTFDRRMLSTRASGGPDPGPSRRPICSFTVPDFGNRAYRITSLCFSPEGDEVLVSYSSDHLYLFNVKQEAYMKLESKNPANDNEDKVTRSRSPPPVRRLRLRGDWSDTGPDARPEREGNSQGEIGQARPILYPTLMQRMTDVLTRMLNDPATRAALSGGGEESIERADSNLSSPSQDNISPSQIPTVQPEQSPEQPSEGTDEQLQVNSPTISVPQMSSLSLNPTARDANDQDLNMNDTNTVSMEESRNASNVLDLRCVPYGESSDNDCNQVGTCDSVMPTSAESVQNTSAELSSIAGQSGKTESNIRDDSEVCNTPFQPSMNFIQRNISSLQDKLTTLREGFIERHGSEPAVRLTYSEKSSSNATISLGVADEVSCNLRPDDASPVASSTTARNDDIEGKGSSLIMQEPQPGPSCVRSPIISNSGNFSKERSDSDDDEEEEDDDKEERGVSNVHNCFMLTKNNNVFSNNRSFVHPIEEHMQQAIDAARNDKKCLDETNDHYQPFIKQKFTGHRNARTMIKEATFWGNSYVLSGSDCGHVFIWDRFTGSLVMLLEADRHVVNCLQPHPVLPILATSGIDYDVKLWEPLQEQPSFDKDLADVLTKRNEVMLEETKDTITVPASFMIRMLACLNQIRRGGRSRSRNTRRQSYDDSTNN